MNFCLVRTVICLGICGLLPGNANACNIYTLSNGNSSISVDAGSQRGMCDWTVDGRDQLDQQWFWYRIGNAGPEASIDTIGCPTVTQPTAATLQMCSATKQFSFQVLYALVGGAQGSGAASVSEQIRIQNLTANALDFHFFQYAHFDLSGTAELGRNPLGLFNDAFVTGNGSSVTEQIDTAVSPGANHGVAGLASVCRFNDAFPTCLGDSAGPSTNASWALEWDQTLAAKGTLIIGNVTNLAPVPEPPGLALVFAGLTAVAALRPFHTSKHSVRGTA